MFSNYILQVIYLLCSTNTNGFSARTGHETAGCVALEKSCDFSGTPFSVGGTEMIYLPSPEKLWSGEPGNEAGSLE